MEGLIGIGDGSIDGCEDRNDTRKRRENVWIVIFAPHCYLHTWLKGGYADGNLVSMQQRDTDVADCKYIVRKLGSAFIQFGTR